MYFSFVLPCLFMYFLLIFNFNPSVCDSLQQFHYKETTNYFSTNKHNSFKNCVDLLLNPNKSGPDELSPQLLKLVAEKLAPSLTFLFQQSYDLSSTSTPSCCCCCCRPHSTNVLPAESSTRIMWQPTVSPPRWQGNAPLCRDSSRGPC